MSNQHRMRMAYLEGKANLSKAEKSELANIKEFLGLAPAPTPEPELEVKTTVKKDK